MNLRRLLRVAAAACLLSVPALAQQAGERKCPPGEQPAPSAPSASTTTPAAQPERPVVSAAQIPVEPPQNLAAAYGPSCRQPAAGDAIKVRRDFAPELRDSVQNTP